MTANGQPDNARAARYVLKDFMNGRLLYCHAPPNVEQDIYHTWPEKQKTGLENRVLPPREARAIRVSNVQKKFAKNLCSCISISSWVYCNLCNLFGQKKNKTL